MFKEHYVLRMGTMMGGDESSEWVCETRERAEAIMSKQNARLARKPRTFQIERVMTVVVFSSANNGETS